MESDMETLNNSLICRRHILGVKSTKKCGYSVKTGCCCNLLLLFDQLTLRWGDRLFQSFAVEYKGRLQRILRRFRRGVNRGMEIRRSVLFFGPNPSILRYFRSNPDPHYVKSYCCIRLLQ